MRTGAGGLEPERGEGDDLRVIHKLPRLGQVVRTLHLALEPLRKAEY